MFFHIICVEWMLRSISNSFLLSTAHVIITICCRPRFSTVNDVHRDEPFRASRVGVDTFAVVPRAARQGQAVQEARQL